MIYLWAFVLLMIYIYVYYSDTKRVIDKMFPGPFRVPFFGNALLCITTPTGIYRKYLSYPKYYNYKTFRAWFLHKPYIFVTDYKVAKSIFNSPICFDKADEYKLLDAWLGDEFVFSGPEAVWKNGRKAVTPAFHFNVLKQYFPVFDSNSKIFNKKLEKHDGKDAFDVAEYLTLYTLDNICAAVMGVNFQTQNDPKSEYVKAIKKSDRIFKISSSYRLQEKSLKIVHGYSNKVIQERKRQLRQTYVPVDEETFCDLKENNVFLDTLLENGNAVGFGDKEIRQSVDGLMFGGHDTVTSALSFLFYTLAQHQDVQEKVYQELKKIFQKSDKCPNFDDLTEMKYMEQTIKETLRLYTIAPLIARKPSEDFHINEKQFIPKDTTIVILLGAIHRDPEIWPDPNKFNPERFSPEASQNRDPYAFLAFGGGPRNCLGAKFAMYALKITLSRILRKFKLVPSENPRDEMQMRPNLVMTSANGIRIKVESRDLNNNAEQKNG